MLATLCSIRFPLCSTSGDALLIGHRSPPEKVLWLTDPPLRALPEVERSNAASCSLRSPFKSSSPERLGVDLVASLECKAHVCADSFGVCAARSGEKFGQER
jgi:hypothetical protein